MTYIIRQKGLDHEGGSNKAKINAEILDSILFNFKNNYFR